MAHGHGLRAVTRPLAEEHPGGLDLNDVAGSDGYLFVRDGFGVAGRGVAAVLGFDDAAEALAAIDHDDHVGDISAIALGAVPFEPAGSASLIVPQVLVGKDAAGRQWVTRINDDGQPLLPPAADTGPGAATFSVGPLTPIPQYLAAVAAARDAVRDGTLRKAVIARQIRVGADHPIDVHAVLRRLKASFGSSYRYSIDGLVGASPELLVEVDHGTVRSRPLAGTAPRSGDPDADAAAAERLLASVKDQIEHRVVIDMIHETLLPYCSFLDWEPEPSIISVANVLHLATYLEGPLSEPGAAVTTLVRALNPTPALGGYPQAEALDLIRRVEGFDRGEYGGAVGWVDGNGNGTWAVAIRCARFSADRRSAVLSAGGGIVAASEPAAELAETQAKLQAMLAAIVRP
jgi:isochorismate synthase